MSKSYCREYIHFWRSRKAVCCVDVEEWSNLIMMLSFGQGLDRCGKCYIECGHVLEEWE